MPPKKKPAHGSKKLFVLKHPQLTAREVVAEARRAGISISVPHVYTIRSAASRIALTPRPSANERRRAKVPLSRADAKNVTEAHRRFLDSVLEIGLIRAAEIIASLRRNQANLDA